MIRRALAAAASKRARGSGGDHAELLVKMRLIPALAAASKTACRIWRTASVNGGLPKAKTGRTALTVR